MVKLVDTLDSKSNVFRNVWVRVPPSVHMNKIDLHGLKHSESKIKVLLFIENNLDNLPIEIITGNSLEMQNIVKDIADSFELKISFPNHKNLGSFIIMEKY